MDSKGLFPRDRPNKDSFLTSISQRADEFLGFGGDPAVRAIVPPFGGETLARLIDRSGDRISRLRHTFVALALGRLHRAVEHILFGRSDAARPPT